MVEFAKFLSAMEIVKQEVDCGGKAIEYIESVFNSEEDNIKIARFLYTYTSEDKQKKYMKSLIKLCMRSYLQKKSKKSIKEVRYVCKSNLDLDKEDLEYIFNHKKLRDYFLSFYDYDISFIYHKSDTFYKNISFSSLLDSALDYTNEKLIFKMYQDHKEREKYMFFYPSNTLKVEKILYKYSTDKKEVLDEIKSYYENTLESKMCHDTLSKSFIDKNYILDNNYLKRKKKEISNNDYIFLKKYKKIMDFCAKKYKLI